MKKFLLTISMIASTSSFSQEMVEPIDGISDIPEKMQVSGQRIYPDAIFSGVLMASTSTGRGSNPGYGKGGGDKGVYTRVKNKKEKKEVNERNKNKAKNDWAKDYAEKIGEQLLLGTSEFADFLKEFFDFKVATSRGSKSINKTTNPDGSVTETKNCTWDTVSTGNQPQPPNPCMQFIMTPIDIEQDDGKLKTELLVTFNKYDACYTKEPNVMKCIPLDGFVFVVDSLTEFNSIMNEVSSTNLYNIQ